jgi:ABC-type branched-subunit amino acid transport system substrate-binding protein
MKISKRQWMGSAVAALLAAAAPWSVHAAGVSDKEIVIGTHLDLSGPVAAGMPQLRNGTQMRFDEVNEAGGIHGRRIRFIVEDNASQPQQAVRAVDKLIRKDEVFAMVNTFGSGTNAAVVKRAVDEGVIYFAPWAASAVLQQIGLLAALPAAATDAASCRLPPPPPQATRRSRCCLRSAASSWSQT